MNIVQGDNIKATTTTKAATTVLVDKMAETQRRFAHQKSTVAFAANRTNWQAATAAASFEQDATIAIDALGQVRFCSAAAQALLGRSKEQVHLHPIAALIPDLPIKAKTPGYNAAFIAFWFGNGRWRRHEALDGHRRPISVEVAAAPIDMGSERGYVVALRRSMPADEY